MNIENAKQSFQKIIESSFSRLEKMQKEGDFIDYSSIDKIKIGICFGDGIGPFITNVAKNILLFLLKDDIENNKIELIDIEGLTIENRIKALKAIPDDILDQIKNCHVILKGPTTTPNANDNLPNIESANVFMRKALDLFANVRPIKIESENIDWIFFRENTEGSYAFGSHGINFNDDLAIDFTLATNEGTKRIIKAAFEYAKNNKKTKITAVTKANIIKATDGMFLKIFYDMAKQYDNIKADDWFIDIMTAKLIDNERRSDFQVFVLPNLYGDILTDEAAQIQGGVGTAGSANIGKKYAMFEAIHGSAPRMVLEGRGQFADPTSILKATQMLLLHIGKIETAKNLENAINKSLKSIKITGRSDGNSAYDLEKFIINNLK